jgi:hypothetical protein
MRGTQAVSAAIEIAAAQEMLMIPPTSPAPMIQMSLVSMAGHNANALR